MNALAQHLGVVTSHHHQHVDADSPPLLTYEQMQRRISDAADNWIRGRDFRDDPQLEATLVARAQLVPPYRKPSLTAARRRAIDAAQLALVAMKFRAPAADVIGALVRAADLYEAADAAETSES